MKELEGVAGAALEILPPTPPSPPFDIWHMRGIHSNYMRLPISQLNVRIDSSSRKQDPSLGQAPSGLAVVRSTRDSGRLNPYGQ